MTLNEVVPWGRSLVEYKLMFMLTEADEQKHILGVGDGPASFNAEMTKVGRSIISVDPIYAFSKADIEQRIEQTYPTIISQLASNADQYNWIQFRNTTELGKQRKAAMRLFLDDYETGCLQDRYQFAKLPVLPFTNQAFNMALCSHLLFLYSDHLSQDMHQQSIREMIRVANEVRIFPLITLAGKRSPHLESILAMCQSMCWRTSLVTVPYHFQKNADQMLIITKN